MQAFYRPLSLKITSFDNLEVSNTFKNKQKKSNSVNGLNF